MVFVDITFGIIIIIFSYFYLRSISFYAHRTITYKNYDNIKVINASDFISLFESLGVDWEINKDYKNSIFFNLKIESLL